MVVPAPPLLQKFRRYQKFCETEETPNKVFPCSEAKNFRQNHGAPPYALKFSIQEIYWNTEGVSYEVFRYCETEIFDTKSWYPLLMEKNFSIIEIFGYTELFRNKIFR